MSARVAVASDVTVMKLFQNRLGEGDPLARMPRPIFPRGLGKNWDSPRRFSDRLLMKAIRGDTPVRVRWSISCLLLWAALGIAKSALAAGEAQRSPPASDRFDYAVADPALRVERLDSSPQESFLAVRVDPLGRVFVGGRDGLFVYDPAEDGGYLPKRLLFKFSPNSWVYDVEFRGNDLYVLTMSALYLVPDGVIQRTDLHPKRLVWGVPRGHVHQCFHALAWGPEGDLYISMGDPLWYYGDFDRADHWGFWNFHVQPEGTLVPYNGVGGVFRCRPDGSRFEVIARGLRNPCGLAFDDHWNLFSNDNDHESLPALYVPGAWRM